MVSPLGPRWYQKPTMWVTSPRVVAAARAHFGCPTLKGLALEDLPYDGSYGSHWEARLMGPEVGAHGHACMCPSLCIVSACGVCVRLMSMWRGCCAPLMCSLLALQYRLLEPVCVVRARPQLMSYGKGTGEAYLSAITIAFMEDTGHYVAVNGSGGSMVIAFESPDLSER